MGALREVSIPLSQGDLVLLVEDDTAVRKISRERLVELGYKVMEASAADEAIDLLRDQNNVSLIFSDTRLPGELSGHDLAKWTYENRPDTKVLLTSGYNYVETDDGKTEVNVKATVLPKPYSMKELAIALDESLSSAK